MSSNRPEHVRVTRTRREFVRDAFCGFGSLALASILLRQQARAGAINPLNARPAHQPAKAKAVIFLFMCGGVSHIDTFDPKGNRLAGKMIEAIGFGDNLAKMLRPVIPCNRTFTPYGKSGIPVSDWFPHVGSVIDNIAVVRSMFCHETNHSPAVIEMTTGHRDRLEDQQAVGAIDAMKYSKLTQQTHGLRRCRSDHA